MQNHSLSFSVAPGMSCDGYMYIRSLNTRAVGSAENWSRITGFCAVAVGSNTAAAESNTILRVNMVGYLSLKRHLELSLFMSNLPNVGVLSATEIRASCSVSSWPGTLFGIIL